MNFVKHLHHINFGSIFNTNSNSCQESAIFAHVKTHIGAFETWYTLLLMNTFCPLRLKYLLVYCKTRAGRKTVGIRCLLLLRSLLMMTMKVMTLLDEQCRKRSLSAKSSRTTMERGGLWWQKSAQIVTKIPKQLWMRVDWILVVGSWFFVYRIFLLHCFLSLLCFSLSNVCFLCYSTFYISQQIRLTFSCLFFVNIMEWFWLWITFFFNSIYIIHFTF